jgi:hypothetical protein
MSKVQASALSLIGQCAFAAASVGLLVPTASNAAPQPMILSPTFADATPPKVGRAKGAASCAAHFVELVDARRAPETLGVVGRRAIYAPKDPTAWLISIISSLKSRGITPILADGQSSTLGAIEAKVSLQTLWITEGVGGITTTAVMRVQAKGAAERTIEQYYRSNMLKTGYWSGGPSVVQASIDGALSKLLDAMATDLQIMCKP